MNKYRILTTLTTLLISCSSHAQSVEFLEMRHPIIYPFTIDPKTANHKYNDEGTHTPITEEYGFVIIPPSTYRQMETRGGSLGIIVAHHPGDRYGACELRCARCLYEYRQCNKMTPMKSMQAGRVLGFFECKHCKAQIGSFVYTGNLCLDHYEYKGTYIITQECYVVEEIKDDSGKIISLRITNPVPLIESLKKAEQSKKSYGIEPSYEIWFPHATRSEFE